MRFLYINGSILALASTFCSAIAQTPGAAQPAAKYEVPHTTWGAPDFQGVWTNSSLTRLQRPGGVEGLVLTAEQAKKMEDADYNIARIRAEQAPSDQTAGAPEKGVSLRGIGNYNASYIDPGLNIATVNGELRSSWITEPANGRMPLKPEARKIYELGFTASAQIGYDGPEARSLGERCLIGFGGTGGPIMQNVLYNNHYRIVQTPDHAMILVEMNHDARIIPLKGVPRPVALGQWLGDSVGRYEGDTLVVETRNVHPQQKGPVMLSANGKVTERFTRKSDAEILYQFEVDDPLTYTQTWRGEMPLRRREADVFEYACHEGNHSMPGILAGARRYEKLGIALATTADSE